MLQKRTFRQTPERWVLPALLGVAAMVAVGTAVLSRFPAIHQNFPAHLHMETAAPVSGAAARPSTVVKVVSCEKLPNVPGKSIVTTIVDFPPSAFTPRHRHPGSVTAFVLKGTLRSQLAGGPPGLFTVGQTWFEPPGTIHLFAENASPTEPAQLLAIFVADDDCGPLTIFD